MMTEALRNKSHFHSFERYTRLASFRVARGPAEKTWRRSDSPLSRAPSLVTAFSTSGWNGTRRAWSIEGEKKRRVELWSD